MKRVCAAVCFIFILFSCKKNDSPAPVPPVVPPVTDSSVHVDIRGADLSFLTEIEQAGTKFYDSTGETPVLDIFKEYGCNLVRVRLWYQPATPHSGMDEVLAFCKRINAAGMQIFLDFHYSDTWADPSHQSTPTTWAGLPVNKLKDSVKAYTQRVIGLMKAQNTLPSIVQVGNEINAGILWDAGKINNFADPNFSNFAALLKSGIDGVKAADTDNKIAIMLHYAEIDGAADFFTDVKAQGVNYDIIGLSYYPWWSNKDLAFVQQQLTSLANKFNKKIMIAETAYPWTLGWHDNTNNIIGDNSQLISGYPATPYGQLKYLEKLKTILASLPAKLGIGFCYWEPDWVAFKGTTATDGSNAENLTLFDFTNKALAGLKAYKQ